MNITIYICRSNCILKKKSSPNIDFNYRKRKSQDNFKMKNEMKTILEKPLWFTVIATLCLVVVTLFATSGCDMSETSPTNENNTLQGSKWKLIGIVDVETGKLTELEPKDCGECYTLTFIEDSVFNETLWYNGQVNVEIGWYKLFTGRSSSNFIACLYKMDYKTGAFYIYNIGGTEINEVGNGYLYRQILLKTQSFTVKDTYPRILHLYYDDGKNYLKYKEK